MPFAEVRKLKSLARDAAACTPDAPRELSNAIKTAIASPADPMLLAGVLIEGLAQTIRTAIPAERQGECLAAAIDLLMLRTRA
jgi:hypothetical protein